MIGSRSADATAIGQGYVGLPLAMLAVEVLLKVRGE
jgi:hypothetical protein